MTTRFTADEVARLNADLAKGPPGQFDGTGQRCREGYRGQMRDGDVHCAMRRGHAGPCWDAGLWWWPNNDVSFTWPEESDR